jgi:hypothetical protein
VDFPVTDVLQMMGRRREEEGRRKGRGREEGGRREGRREERGTN